MKLIVSGSRSISSYVVVATAIEDGLKKFRRTVEELVSGGARGVDRLGEEWADKHGVSVRQFIPEWDKRGKSAGFLRNEAMAEYADALVAVWDGESRGTKQMIETARRRLLLVHVHVHNGAKHGSQVRPATHETAD